MRTYASSLSWIEHIGQYGMFLKNIFHRFFSTAFKWRLLLVQMEYIGVKSFLIIVMAAIMIGGVFAIQFGQIFKIFGAESMIGAAASFALSKELAPIIGAFLVTGRSGSAMTAEIATMRVNEQIDAMHVMAVNPVAYLVCPRVLASVLMLPLLTGVFILTGVISAYFMSVSLFDIDQGVFIEKIKWISKPRYILQGLEKSVFFAFIFSTLCCYKGFYASGGAKGVGKATTEAVVISLVTILVSDFFISYIQLGKVF